jgi:hypothetical protein
LAHYFFPQVPSSVSEDVLCGPGGPVLLFYCPRSTALLSIDIKHECETKSKSKCSAAAGARAAGTVPGLRGGACCRQRVLACATGARVRLEGCVGSGSGVGKHGRQGSGPQVLLPHARCQGRLSGPGVPRCSSGGVGSPGLLYGIGVSCQQVSRSPGVTECQECTREAL